MKKRLLIIAMLITALVFSLCACSGGDGVDITLSDTELSISETAKNAIIYATTSSSATEFDWEIDDDSVASITGIGSICIIVPKKPASTKVRVKVGTSSAECTLTVVPLDIVTVKNGESEITSLTIAEGEHVDLTASSAGGNAVKWQVVNTDIATVNDHGRVTGVRRGATKLIAAVNTVDKTEIDIFVTDNVTYDLEGRNEDGAVQSPGTWTYFAWTGNPFAVSEAAYAKGTVTLAFSNNTGSWYDAGITYKQPGLTVGGVYTMIFYADLIEGDECEVTVNKAQETMGTDDPDPKIKTVTLQPGKHLYNVTITVANGHAEFALIFGVKGTGPTLQAGKVAISGLTFVKA